MHKVSKSGLVLFLVIIVSLIIVLLIIVSLTIRFYHKNDAANSSESQTYLYHGKKNIECLYYNLTDFIHVPDYPARKDVGTIHGCIVPHHLTAKDFIHEVFQNVRKDQYKTVVLIGPDHESINKGKIFTTLSDWQTPTGILETNDKITSKLLNHNFIVENDEKLSQEHSTSSIIPFVKFYLGDVNVVTLVLTKQVKLDDIDILTEELFADLKLDETLFIASVDFSHYLDLDKANDMDLESMEAIDNKDISKIMSFNNDNLDSPISVVTMLKIMDKIGSHNSCILNHSNSELVLKKKLEETTSYITYLFY